MKKVYILTFILFFLTFKKTLQQQIQIQPDTNGIGKIIYYLKNDSVVIVINLYSIYIYIYK